MSFTDSDEKCRNQYVEKSSDSDGDYQTDEDFSDESFSDSIKRLKRISMAKGHKSSTSKKNVRPHHCRLNVSLRNVKHGRNFRAKTDSRKTPKRKTIKAASVEHKKCLDGPTEAPKNGKRCRLGGKAKGNPPEEEPHDKSESDDENDNYYFSRISLGYFQKFRDKSGASTSYEWNEEITDPLPCDIQETRDKLTEEMELLELQRWGVTSLVYNRKSQVLDKTEKVLPDSL